MFFNKYHGYINTLNLSFCGRQRRLHSLQLFPTTPIMHFVKKRSIFFMKFEFAFFIGLEKDIVIEKFDTCLQHKS